MLVQAQKILYTGFGLWLLGGPLAGPLIAISDLLEQVGSALAQALQGIGGSL